MYKYVHGKIIFVLVATQNWYRRGDNGSDPWSTEDSNERNESREMGWYADTRRVRETFRKVTKTQDTECYESGKSGEN